MLASTVPSALCPGKGWSRGPGSTDLLYGLGQVPFPFGHRLPVSKAPDVLGGPLRPAQGCTFWFQKLAAERDALQRELEELKKKFEGVKSRNKVLASEVKTLRSQTGTLVEKGRHDDELIDALMVRPRPEACDWPGPKCHLHDPAAPGLQMLTPGAGAAQKLPKGV